MNFFKPIKTTEKMFLSNSFLQNKWELGQQQIDELQKLGWRPPTSDKVNFYREWQAYARQIYQVGVVCFSGSMGAASPISEKYPADMV